MMKRAKRLAGEALERLADIHSGGVTRADASALIKVLWTMELPEELLAGLSEKLMVILEDWRCGRREALTGLEIWRVAGAQKPVAGLVLVSPGNASGRPACAAGQTEDALVIPHENFSKT